MSLKIAQFLAWRYVQEATHQSTIKTMIWICLTSVFVGTFSLALILSIMSGFEAATSKKLQGTYPDIIIESPSGAFLDTETLIPYLQKNYPSAIAYTCAYSSLQLLVQPIDTPEPTIVGMMKGIQPKEEACVSALCTRYSLPLQEVEQRLHDDAVIVGKGLAEQLNATPGTMINLLYNPDPHAKLTEMHFSTRTAKVIGIIDTGIADYDSTLIIAHQSFIHELLEDDCIKEIGLKLLPSVNAQKLAHELSQLPGIVAYRWQDLYPSLVSALKLEKYVMGFILGLITLVASMNNISLLYMFITSKRTEIALLKSFGMSNTAIALIFIFFNSIITTLASATGLLGAYATGKLLDIYPLFELPDVYYVTHLPIHLDPILFICIFFFVLFLSVLTALLPISSLKKINITHTLRFE